MAGRKKLNRSNLHARVAPDTTTRLKNIAYTLGYTYNKSGSIGKLLDARSEADPCGISTGEVLLVGTKKPPISG